jgi:hypothetical protein
MKKSLYLSGLLALCFSAASTAVKAQAPTITVDPSNDTVCTGTQAKFFVSHSGTTTGVKWQESTDAGATWNFVSNGGVFSGATTDTLKAFASMSMSGYDYRAVVYNTPADSVISDFATLKVDTAFAGLITADSAICEGSTSFATSTVLGGTWSSSHPAVDTVTPGFFGFGFITARGFGFDTLKYTIMNACGTSVSTAPFRVDTTVSQLPIIGPSAVCKPGIVFYTNGNTLGSFAWSTSSSGNATITATGALTAVNVGLDTVTYVFSNACNSVTSTKPIVIEDTLSSSSVSGPSFVCVGHAIVLSGLPVGGIWISSSSSIAVVDGAGTVTGAAQGTAVISYYRSNACGASVATKTVMVDAVAGTIAGIDSIGVGATRTFTDATIGGTWSTANPAVATVATVAAGGVVAGVAVGTTTLSYTVTNNCGTSFATSIIHVGNAPSAGVIYTLTGKDTVCVAGTLALGDSTAELPGTWSMTNAKASISAAGLVSGASIGLDTAQYTVSNAFGTSVARRILHVFRAHVDSVTGPSTVALGGSYTLTGYPAGGMWSVIGDSAVALVNPVTGIIVAVGPGTAVFTYTITNLCGTDTKTFTIHLSTASVGGNPATGGSLSVAPNPANGTFALNVDAPVSSSVNVTITNVVGEKVKEFTTATNHVTNVRLDQPAGLYIITATTETGKYTTKLIIK